MTDQIPPRNRAERRAMGHRARKFAALGSGVVLAAGAAGTTTALLTSTSASAAAPIVVTSLTDDGTGTTLREAIEQANTDAGQDTITFETGLGSATITLASNLPNITDAVQIQGPGASVVTVDGATQFQIFNFYAIQSSAGTNGVTGLTLTHGVADNGDGSGGAIVSRNGTADLTIADSVITDNHAGNDGGGVQFYDSDGAMVISGTTISNNTADGGGGGLYADGSKNLSVTITNSTFTGNTAASGRGGGLYLEDTTSSISGTTISGNTASENSGGGIWANYSTLSVDGGIISGNTAGEGGGGLYLEATPTTIEFTTVSGNTATGDGGGGIKTNEHRNEGTPNTVSTFTLRNSTVSGNTGQYYGGGLYITLAGQTTIENSTISGNSARQAGGIYGGYAGIALTQVTLSNNTATAPDSGTPVGGIQLAGAGEIAAAGSRHAGASSAPAHTEKEQAKQDHASAAQSDVHAAAAGTVDAVGTIIAGNAGQDIGTFKATLDVHSDHSILGTLDPNVTVTDQGGTQQGVTNPGLAPLAGNGGPTETMALVAGSTAINAGPVPEPSFPGNEFDQRGDGFARVVDGVVDVGAYEVQPPEGPAAAPLVITPRFTG